MNPWLYLLTFIVGCYIYVWSGQYIASIDIQSHLVNTLVYFMAYMGLFWGILGIMGAFNKCETELKCRNKPLGESEGKKQ